MEKKYSYTTHGTCSRQIDVTLDGDVIKEVVFHRGCMGNTQGVAALVKGMKAQDAIERLSGIDCGGKGTSCPDQLARALSLMLAEQN